MKKFESPSTIDAYRQEIDCAIQEIIPRLGSSSTLRDACQYALTVGGKRFRPLITLLVAKALNKNASVIYSALAVEFFHTASLVVDDLPCMDDDDVRRSHPSTHKKHGEAIALLVSYALIASGYENISKNAAVLSSSLSEHSLQSDRICVVALEHAAKNTGLQGATGGQFIDIFPVDFSESAIRDVIYKKTTSLFELAFVFGWIYGGGSLDLIPDVELLAYHYGMAFQIVDDLEDFEADGINGRSVNAARAFGQERARQMFHEEIEAYLQKLRDLNIETQELRQIAEDLQNQASLTLNGLEAHSKI